MTPAIQARCIQALQLYTRLAVETLEAEFPSFELLACFHILNVAPNVDVRSEFQEFSSALGRLAQVLELDEEELAEELQVHEAIARHEASQGRSTFDAWKQAVLRTSACQRSVREHFPCNNLWKLLTRYGAWSGASTSGIEQLFSRVCDHVPADRACLTEEHLFYEVKVLADVTKANQKDICELAQMCWALISDAPRKSSTSRIDKGVPRKRLCGTEVDFKKKRRLALTDAAEMVPLAATREEARVMRPDAPRLARRVFFLQEDDWANKAWARKLRLCSRLEDAAGFIVEDAAAPPEPILWAVALPGGVVADCVYAESEGRGGAAFTYSAATQTRRCVFIDDDWAAANAALADILLSTLEQPTCKWRLLPSWEDFADASSRGGTYSSIALTTPEAANHMSMANVFSETTFVQFLTNKRVACSHSGMCGV